MIKKNSKKQQVWLVTSWEFMHFFKWKQEIISKLIIVAIGLIIMLWQYIKDDQLTVYKVAVPATMSQLQNSDSFDFIASNAPLKQLKKQLAQEDNWDAVLSETPSTNSVKQITLYSKDKQSWLGELKQTLNQQYTVQYASSLGLAEEQLNVLNQSSIFENKYLDESIKSDNSPAKATAIAMIVILAIGIFTSFGQLFVSVTGEKQQRVTEQLYACISAQTWIDGKILGQMLHSIKAMITIVITGMLGYAFVTVIIKGGIIDFSMIDWSLLPWLIPFALTGVYLCTAFMAAIAAAIDDPNHSAKTSIMLLPLVPMILAFITMDGPSGWALTFLSFFPLTSFVAMPVKMSLIDVPLWHSLLSLSLLVILCFWVRTAAARLFKMGMSMYGKEPSFKDMMRWVAKEK
ncbi:MULTISPECIES: ABC transporter permease [unclassified Colwellia]|uniref:ABC transporter permease n=1 Tax=unclassified Colwellia TaxID=196834 RepID=UPI0015F5BE9A|nr:MULTISPECIES: ABC transporter permease [unclassified Colwellia]MBA6256651.1 ABC transporter permease [Colwellia sp. MB3u-28]MBA6261366.1 ABC transporter permease [Colwellia sp. MB3u-41]